MSNCLELDIGLATLSTYDDDGVLTVQVDAYGEGKSGVAPYEQHSPLGILSRCHDPSTDDDARNRAELHRASA